MIYGKVFKALNKARVKYVVAGGVAVVLHGYLRFTNDLDIIVFLESKNLDKLFDSLHKIGYLPKVPVTKEQFKDEKQRNKWKKEKGMIVFSFCNKKPPFDLIDMFIEEVIPFDQVYQNKKFVRIENLRIPVISIEHLIKLKEKASRSKDFVDIVQLNEIKRLKRND